MAEPKSPWEEIEAMPEFQAKTPEEKLGYASTFLERQAASLAPDLAGNPEAQAYFRDRSKQFLFGIADKHFPSGLDAAPSQIGESFAREERALSMSGARLNTDIGKQAQATLQGLEGKADDEILKGDSSTFKTISPNSDTTVAEYRKYLESVVNAQAVKGGGKIGDVVESFDSSAKRTPSAAMLKLQLSEGWAGWDELMAKSNNPVGTAIAAIAGTMLESSVQSGKGAVVGAATTLATGNPIAGGVAMGGVAAESEYQATYLGELQEELQKRGKADAATIQEILQDDEFNARVDKKAKIRGITIGATEAVAGGLSFGLANKIGANTAKKALIGVGAEAGIGGVGGSGGEFLARLFSGDDIWTPEARKDILSEGVAELGQAGIGTATVAAKRALLGAEAFADPVASPVEGETPASETESPVTPAPTPATTPDTEIDDAPVSSVLDELTPDESDAPIQGVRAEFMQPEADLESGPVEVDAETMRTVAGERVEEIIAEVEAAPEVAIQREHANNLRNNTEGIIVLDRLADVVDVIANEKIVAAVDDGRVALEGEIEALVSDDGGTTASPVSDTAEGAADPQNVIDAQSDAQVADASQPPTNEATQSSDTATNQNVSEPSSVDKPSNADQGITSGVTEGGWNFIKNDNEQSETQYWQSDDGLSAALIINVGGKNIIAFKQDGEWSVSSEGLAQANFDNIKNGKPVRGRAMDSAAAQKTEDFLTQSHAYHTQKSGQPSASAIGVQPLSPDNIGKQSTPYLEGRLIEYQGVLRDNLSGMGAGDPDARVLAELAQDGVNRIKGELDRRRNDPSFSEPTQALSPAQIPAAKEPWQMTRGDYEESAKPNKIPPAFEALDALAKRNNRGSYNPNAITDAAILELKKAGWISGTKNFKLTASGRDRLNEWRRDTRDNDMAAGDASDMHIEYVEKALQEGKPVPAEVLAEYGLESTQSPANESEISSTEGGVATVTSDLPDHVNAKSLPVFIAKDWTELTADELPPLNRELEGYGQWRRTIAAMLLPGGTKIQHEAIAMELGNEIASENSAMGADSWQYNILANSVAGRLLTGAKPEIIERAKNRALSDELAQWESGRKFDKEPISVALVESQGMNVPEGYVQDGDIYVYRPIQSPAPAAPAQTSSTEATPEIISSEDIPVNENLIARIKQDANGTYTVSRVNAKTGKEFPLAGEARTFTDRKEANAYARETFSVVDEVAPVETAQEVKDQGETDPLMLFLSQNTINDSTTNIADIGALARQKKSGTYNAAASRAKENLGSFDGAPRAERDYPNNPKAKERLSRIYGKKRKGGQPDQVAQEAFRTDPTWFPPGTQASDVTGFMLFDAINERLATPDGRPTITANEQAAALWDEQNQTVQGAYDNFHESLASPQRSGGITTGSTLRVGDVLTVDGETFEVTEVYAEGADVDAGKFGMQFIDAGEQVGFDAIEGADGGPIDFERREAMDKSDLVTEAEAVELSDFVNATLKKRVPIDTPPPPARVVSSAEHNQITRGREELDVARRLAEFFGFRVVGVDGLPGGAAVIRGDGRNIFLEVRADRADFVLVTHEMLHQLHDNAPELYDKLVEALRADPNYQAALEIYVNELRPQHRGKDPDLIEEEFLADYLMDRGGDPAFWEGLYQKDPGFFEELVEFIRKFLESVKQYISENRLGADQLLRNVAAMDYAMTSALIDFRARMNAGDFARRETAVDEDGDPMPFADARPVTSAADQEYLAAVESGDMEAAQRMVDDASGRETVYGGTPMAESPSVYSPEIAGSVRTEPGRQSQTTGLFFFTPNEEVARGYARQNNFSEAGTVRGVKLFYDRPLVFPKQVEISAEKLRSFIQRNTGYDLAENPSSSFWTDDLGLPVTQAGGSVFAWRVFEGPQGPMVIEAIKRAGFDAVEFTESSMGTDKDGFLNYRYKKHPTIAVFRPDQIKSADPVTRDESGNVIPPSQRFNPKSDDIRFADEYNGQSFGNKGVAEPAESQRLVDDLIPQIKRDHFDGDGIVNGITTAGAFRIFELLEAGRIDLRAQYDKDAANQVLIGELAIYARKLLAEGDPDLYNLIEAKKNKAVDNEASAAARVLNALQFYTRELDKAAGIIRKAKTAVVEKMGKGTADFLGQVQVSFDAAIEAIKSFTPEQRSVILELVSKGRTDAATSQVEDMARKFSGKKKPGAKVTSVMEAFAAAQESFLSGDVKFADESLTQQQKKEILDLLTRRVVMKGSVKLSRFVAELKRAGFAKEFFTDGHADRIYAQALDFHNKAKAAKAEDATTEQSKTEKAEPTFAEQWLAAMDASDAIADRINKKVKSAIERVKGTRKPRQESADPIDRLVKDSLKAGDNYNRTETIKAAIKLGFTQKAAAEFSDAVEARIADRKAKKQSKTDPSAIARKISERFNNPQDRPPSKKEPIAQLVRLATNQKSTVTEASFMAQMKQFDVAQIDAANLWADIVKDRAIREQARELKKLADAEHAESAEQKEASGIIKKLAASQSDTQDNRPGNPRVVSLVEELYNDALGFGPARSQAEFIAALDTVGVNEQTATRLFELATREKNNRLNLENAKAASKASSTSKGFTPTPGPITLKRQVKADMRTVISLEREILNHPMLRRVGKEVRLQIQARLFEERAGLSPTNAYAAAVAFDKILEAKWIEAGERVVERHTASHNAPFFRKERGTGTGKKAPTGFDMLIKAIRAGALDPSKRILDDIARQQGWVDLSPGELQRLAELDELLHSKGLTKQQIDRLSELNVKSRAGQLTAEEIAEQKELVDLQSQGMVRFEEIRIRGEMIAIYNASSLPDGVLKIIGQAITANIFSGPSTLLIGVSGIMEQVGNMARDTTLAIAGSTVARNTQIGEIRNVTGLLQTVMRGKSYFVQAINDAKLAAMTGEMRSVVAEEISDFSDSLDRVWTRQQKILDNPSSSRSAVAQAWGAMTFTVGRFAYRGLKTVDAFVKGIIGRYVEEIEMFSRVAKMGWTGKQIRGLVKASIANGEIYGAEADAKGFTGNDRRVYIEARTEDAIHRAFKGLGIEVDAILSRSEREANLATGMGQIQDGSYTLGKVAQAAKWFRKEAPLAGPLTVPAVQTPYNVFHRGVWWTPFSIHRYIITGIRTKDADGKWFQNWENTSYQEALADPVQLALRATETALGTALFGGLATLLFDQMDKDDDDEEKWLRINLAGPSTSSRSERSAWLNAGNRPFALQIKTEKGWTTLGFRRGGFEAFNFALTVIGAAEQQKHEKWIGSDDVFNRYFLTLTKELLGESLFFMRSSTSRGVSMDSFGNEIGFRASSFVPLSSFWKTLTRFDDMKEREEGFWGNFAMQMPFVAALSDRRPAINSLGQEVGFNETSKGYMQSKLNIPLGWVPSETPDKTKANPGYKDLLGLMNDKKAFVSTYQKSSLDTSKGRATTDEEFYDFTKARGEYAMAEMKRRYKSLWQMEPERFKEELENISSAATTKAKRAVK